MTATHVDGRLVIMDVPMRARVNARSGDPVYLVQTRELLVEAGDGQPEQTYFGCLHCTYTNLNWKSIRPHLGNCKVKKAKEQDAKDRAARENRAGQRRAATMAEVVTNTKPLSVKAVAVGHWAEAAKRGSAPATTGPKRSLTPTITLDGVLRRLEELQARNTHLEASNAKLASQVASLRAERNEYLGELNRVRVLFGEEPIKAGAGLK